MRRTPAPASQRTLRTRIGSPCTGSRGFGIPAPTAAMRVLLPAASRTASTSIGQRWAAIDDVLTDVADRALQPGREIHFRLPAERPRQGNIGQGLLGFAREVRLVARLVIAAKQGSGPLEDLADRVAHARADVVRHPLRALIGRTQ